MRILRPMRLTTASKEGTAIALVCVATVSRLCLLGLVLARILALPRAVSPPKVTGDLATAPGLFQHHHARQKPKHLARSHCRDAHVRRARLASGAAYCCCLCCGERLRENVRAIHVALREHLHDISQVHDIREDSRALGCVYVAARWPTSGCNCDEERAHARTTEPRP